jgi:hypothetical protein
MLKLCPQGTAGKVQRLGIGLFLDFSEPIAAIGSIFYRVLDRNEGQGA